MIIESVLEAQKEVYKGYIEEAEMWKSEGFCDHENADKWETMHRCGSREIIKTCIRILGKDSEAQIRDYFTELRFEVYNANQLK